MKKKFTKMQRSTKKFNKLQKRSKNAKSNAEAIKNI